MTYKNILVAVDSSSHSIKAAKAGFALAHALKAKVGIVAVVDKSKVVINADIGTSPRQSESVLLTEAEDTISQFIDMYDGVEQVYRFTPEGVPSEEILNIAHEWEADLIIMGSHGKSGLERLFVGSTTEHVIRRSEIPVMIITKKMK